MVHSTCCSHAHTHTHIYLLTCLPLVQMWIQLKMQHQAPKQQHHTPRELVCMHTYSICLPIITYLRPCLLTHLLTHSLIHLLTFLPTCWSLTQHASTIVGSPFSCDVSFNIMFTLLLNSSPTRRLAYMASRLLAWQGPTLFAGAATAWPTPIFSYPSLWLLA